MAKIIQMRDEGIEAYPITKPECVIDEEGKNVRQELTELSERIDNLPTAESDVFKAIYGETTYEEIKAAYDSGKVVHCDFNNHCYALSQFAGTTAWLSSLNVNTNYMLTVGKNGWGIANYTLENTGNRKKVINAESTDESYPTCKAVYDFVQNSKDVFKAVYKQTTFDDIVAARNEGKVVICNKEQIVYILTFLTNSAAYFTSHYSGYVYQLTCNKSGSWESISQNISHKLESLDNGNVQITIAGQTAEVATPQYVENLLGTLINGDY